MNRKDNWQALLMPVSEGFHNRVEETLEQIGKEAKSLQGHRKRTRALRSLAVALVAALLLAGTALAVGRLAGILDFASPRVEDETARQYIEHNLATAQNGRIRLTVREGYYDGEVARTILEIAPVRMEDSIVLHDWWHYPNGEEFFAPGETDWQEGSAHSIAPSLEKAALPPGADGAIAVVGESKNYTEDKAEDLTNCRATAVREGNAVVLYPLYRGTHSQLCGESGSWLFRLYGKWGSRIGTVYAEGRGRGKRANGICGGGILWTGPAKGLRPIHALCRVSTSDVCACALWRGRR